MPELRKICSNGSVLAMKNLVKSRKVSAHKFVGTPLGESGVKSFDGAFGVVSSYESAGGDKV